MNLPTLRQLQYLVAVVELRHFGQAADRCFVENLRRCHTDLSFLCTMGQKAQRVNPPGQQTAIRLPIFLEATSRLVAEHEFHRVQQRPCDVF